MENLYPQTCFKKEGGYDGFEETSRNFEVFAIKVSKTERRADMKNSSFVSTNNGHNTKIESFSNFVLTLSLSC